MIFNNEFSRCLKDFYGFSRGYLVLQTSCDVSFLAFLVWAFWKLFVIFSSLLEGKNES